MDDEQLRAIAAESAETRSQRSSLKETLAVLESGKQVLSEHVGKKISPSNAACHLTASQQKHLARN
jgi:hypothetical protein